MGVLLALAALALAPAHDALVDGFRKVPNAARMRMYWRVFGPAWTPPEIDWELDQIKAAGVGGVTVYFMYPVAPDDPAKGIRNLKFGSPEFLDSFRYAAEAAKKRGLRFGINGSTGWPFGGPEVSVEDSAQQIREVSIARHSDLTKGDPGPGERVVEAFRNGTPIDPAHLSGNGETHEYLAGPTRMAVKRPAYGGEGLVLNHYDSGALRRYLDRVIQPELDAAHGIVENVGCDSLEVYGSNWTADLPEVFRKRRGYDLLVHLPELFDKESAAGKAVRFDFWRTLAELTEERFTKPLGEWCAARHISLEMEPYGTPPNPMTAARSIQTPVGEHYEWKGFAVQKYVASMAHQADRPIVSAEAWTWAGLPNRLADSLSDLKLVSDMTFLLGANDLTAVDFPYSPRSAGSPGWTPYYGPFMGLGNSQWPMFPKLVDYCNRCQWLLRQGEPVRKVAVYLPVEDSFRDGPADQMTLDFYVRDRLVTGQATSEFGLQNSLKHESDLVHGLISSGYDYDGIDFWSIDRVASVGAGTLAVGPARYQAILLPHLDTMDLPALGKILEFCREGGTVVATGHLPSSTPGFIDRTPDLKKAIVALFGSTPAFGVPNPVGKGRAILVAEDADAARALADFVRPSVEYAVHPETVGFQHRRAAGRDIFFFANVGPDSAHLEMKLDTDASRCEVWDAMSGEIRSLPAGHVVLDIPARGSVFVVAGPPTPGAQPADTPETAERLPIAGPWSIRFEGPDAPSPAAGVELGSWTELPGAKFFSGVGVYSTTFTRPSGNGRVFLELGDVREAATVKVNGVDCGTAIVPPYEIEITQALHAGENRLDVEVANLPVNRFIGLPRPDLGPLRKIYGNRFPAPEEHDLMKGVPAPSGLLGPVELRIERPLSAAEESKKPEPGHRQ
ncbi:MAG TPA: glycosyl hydrolase [Fimbriimonadaceae bacterium]|nr:glycosyl hydrolase [Fimbriimonadaceae bacterium]